MAPNSKYAFAVVSYAIAGLMAFPTYLSDEDFCDEGICKKVTDCPPAELSLIRQKSHNFERCGFEGLIEKVCCPPLGNENETPVVRGPITTRKSEIACNEYSNEIGPDPTPHILGGQNATLGEFPHMAALGYAEENSSSVRWDCGGSLISTRFVLTAAHCLVQRDGAPVKIRLGAVDISATNNGITRDFGVFNITIHKSYQRRTKANDLALIELDGEVPITKYVYPACLYQKDTDPREPLKISGWGHTTAIGQVSKILQQATVHAVDLDKCRGVYEARLQRTIIATQLCAISDDGTKDTCQGDSGGPLQVQNQNGSSIYSIVGITSYGMGCGGNTPAIYTRVSSYLDWIESIVWR